MADDQRAALALRVLDGRTALARVERGKNAIEQRWHPTVDTGYSVIDGDHQVSEEKPKPKKTRARTEVAKQATVSERRVKAVAVIYQVTR